ncbi:MAG: corrinoid protein [Deltaproteobacteria bacterium]|nr:corrinoid protein [Deltaproteobacteria bacterium]
MSEAILNNLKTALKEYNREGIIAWSQKVIEGGVDPLEAINALTEVIQEIGDGFTRGDLFLPDLIGAGSTMEAAMPILTGELKKRGLQRKSLGTVVIGTVFGDIHSIGKDMVGTLMTASGFSVLDLGIDVKADKFISAVKEHKPSILAMSALLTTTAKEQKVVIEGLKKENLREKVKVMVGGGAIDQPFANSIGADGYAPTAPEAIVLARNLLGL